MIKKQKFLLSAVFVSILTNYFMLKANLYMMNIIILNYITDFSEIIIKILKIILESLVQMIMFGLYL